MNEIVNRWIKVARETPSELYAEEEARGYRILEGASSCLTSSWSGQIAERRERASTYAHAGLAWLYNSPVNVWDCIEIEFPFMLSVCHVADRPGEGWA